MANGSARSPDDMRALRRSLRGPCLLEAHMTITSPIAGPAKKLCFITGAMPSERRPTVASHGLWFLRARERKTKPNEINSNPSVVYQAIRGYV
jgi:hypothetical protein